MKLESIRVSNFRQYYGEQDTEFSRLDSRNVMVFHGKNGAGKTSLFSAVNWCLYGASVEDIGELVNKRALAEAEEGESVTCRVMIWFMHEANRYTASRSLSVRKAGQKGVSVGTEFDLARVRASGDHEKVDNREGQMNASCPLTCAPTFSSTARRWTILRRRATKRPRTRCATSCAFPLSKGRRPT